MVLKERLSRLYFFEVFWGGKWDFKLFYKKKWFLHIRLNKLIILVREGVQEINFFNLPKSTCWIWEASALYSMQRQCMLSNYRRHFFILFFSKKRNDVCSKLIKYSEPSELNILSSRHHELPKENLC